MEASGFALFRTAIGHCGIAWSEGPEAIAGVQLPEATEDATRTRMQSRFAQAQEASAPAGVKDVMERITALLDGHRDDLADIVLDMTGVPLFNQRVYEVARAIAPGRTMTYGEVASRLGEPGASRAVGRALGSNPFAPVVPCHRVLAADGRPGGFSAGGGVSTKLKMLEIEGARFGGQAGLFDAG
jgi:methylated-DNA-[protein]-cysteine S-methyltransferase